MFNFDMAIRKLGFNNTKCCLLKLFSLTKMLTEALTESKRYESPFIKPCHWLLPLGVIYLAVSKRKRLYFKYIFSS